MTDNNCPKCHNPVLEMTIEEMDLSIRTFNCLKRAGKNTVADLCKMSSYDIFHIRNLGRKGALELSRKLISLGLQFDDVYFVSCPICGEFLKLPEDKQCPVCGFDDIRTEFINDEERLFWETYVVKPCKFAYQLNSSLKNEMLLLREQLEQQARQKYVSVTFSANAFQKKDPLKKFENKEIVYEDDCIAVVFLAWKKVHYINSGDTRVATFMFLNKTDERKCVCFKNISVAGFLNQEKSIDITLPGNEKCVEEINMVYENKVPGKMEEFNSVEMSVCYGYLKEGYLSFVFASNITESPVISLKIDY